MHTQRLVATIFLLAAVLAAPAAAVGEQAVPSIVYENQIAGVRLEIPEDWEMASKPWGTFEFAVDAASGNPGLVHPLVVFFYAPTAPSAQARRMEGLLKSIGGGAVPRVRSTGNGDEWEVTMTSGAGAARGPLVERWLCRQDKAVNYVVGSMVRPDFAVAAKADIDRALSTCRPIRQVAAGIFREPSEQAYTLTLPSGWKWQGRIVRGENIPGAFEWRVASADGAVGCFTAPPGPLLEGYVPAERLAGGPVLASLRAVVPGLQLGSVRRMDRVSDYIRGALKLAGPTMNPLADRVTADYLGTIADTKIRLRVGVLTLTPNFAPQFPGGGGIYCVWGAWAPADNFDALYPLARGVGASLAESPKWTAQQRKAVLHVLGGRDSANDNANDAWDAYVRGMDSIKDPDGGPPQQVPPGPGAVAKDPTGKILRLPEGEQAPVGWTKIKG